MKLLALDFGGTFVKYALIDDYAEICEKGKNPAPCTSLEEFCQFVETKADKYRHVISGIAISLPGVINTDTGYVNFSGRYTDIIREINLGEILQKRTGFTVTIENDAKAAILAEMWNGSLKDADDAAALIIGSGIGCSIILDGELRKGYNHAAGEISAITYEPGLTSMKYSLPGRASMTGFLTNVAEAKGMKPEDFETAGNAEEGGKKIGGEEVFEWIGREDPDVMPVYDAWLKDLCWIMNMLKCIVDPEKIVIGGGVSNNSRFMKDLEEYFEKYTCYVSFPGSRPCRLERCMHSADANLIGAAYIWLKKNTQQ